CVKSVVRALLLVLVLIFVSVPLHSAFSPRINEFLTGLFGEAEPQKEPVFPEVLTESFLFSETELTGGAHLVTAEEIGEYVPLFSAYDSKVYYDTLTEAEQLIYRAFQYALDHSFQEILISEDLKAAAKLRPAEILELLSLDSAHLEQNHFETGQGMERFLVTGARYYGGEEETPMIEGYRITVFSFAKEREEKRLEALEVAKKIDFGFSADATQAEMARAIFRWLGENVTYDEKSTDDFLYGALVDGKTICDGYANAFQLLCGIHGIECCEKMTDFTKLDYGEGRMGHTWNMANLDGVWYNVDPTASENAVGETVWQMGYSDEMDPNYTAYASRLPTATGDAFVYVGHFETLLDEQLVERISDALSLYGQVTATFGKGETLKMDEDGPLAAFDAIADRMKEGYQTYSYRGTRRDVICFELA
ncbi:MAG: hypothetical protein II328_04535, partial [Clostridia bacterium]|nr:hypothetical protein [Clostridia bacterium]